jgi:hypothetical protein
MAKMHVINIGIGSSLSATCGTAIVNILAAKFMEPNAVAENIVGNTSTVETYNRTKDPATPNFVIAINIGINA